jgi:hypothetical protein
MTERRTGLALRTTALAATLGAAAGLALAPAESAGQGVDPRQPWRTLVTTHVRVHFPVGLEDEGRRAAAAAERAWGLLSAELRAPRGPVDVVVADNVDFAQGYAQTFPTNRVVVYAQPPVDVASLRFYDDWRDVLMTHELTHVFHLDRSRGVWRALQHVFGRHPALFPNQYAPAWVTEGLAVYFESRLTGAGRLVGTEHALIARAAALEGRVPRLDQLSLESSVFPAGQQAYAYGSLVLDHLARTGRPGGVGAFVERTSGLLVPYRLNVAAKRAFGVTLEQGWRAWRDSLAAHATSTAAAGSATGTRGGAAGADAADGPAAARDALGGRWREVTREGWFAAYPRWLDDSALVYAANDAREVPGAYRVTLDGARRRVGRRNSLTPNVPLVAGPHAGGLLFTQQDYVDRFTVRGDLWVQRDTARRGPDFGAAAWGERRLTRGARLSHADARARDGAIVAVQSVAGTTRLVRVSPDGSTIAPLTTAVADTQWAEPRWAPDGARLAAVRLARGGVASIVVLDTLGAVTSVLRGERAVAAAPSWSPDGGAVYWSSDRSGRPQLYVAPVAAGDSPACDRCEGGVRRVTGVPTGLVQPVVRPDGGAVAALLFRAGGQHLAVRDVTAGDVASGAPSPSDTVVYAQRSRAGAPGGASGALGPYRPWRTLVPRYWSPFVTYADGGGVLLGAATSAVDVVGRHAYVAQLGANATTGDREGSAAWRYARFGQPVVEASLAQSWQYDTLAVTQGGRRELRPLDRRTRALGLSATFARPRYRTNASLGVGAFIESRAYESTLPRVVAFADSAIGRRFPSLVVSGGWLNTRRPLRSISPEDGVSLSGNLQQRWQDGGALRGTSRRAVGTARAYKSLDLPGFAHHVLAVRVAGGATDRRAATELTVGGVSGTVAELVPGVTVGDPQRTFAVRGFAPGAQRGLRAAAASVEYRAPLALPARGLSLLPLFADRISVSAFADAGTAWCPAGVQRAQQPLCRRTASGSPDLAASPAAPRWLASVGAELALDAALQYDAGYRFRLGVAAPVAERERAERAVSAYVTLGLPF